MNNCSTSSIPGTASDLLSMNKCSGIVSANKFDRKTPEASKQLVGVEMQEMRVVIEGRKEDPNQYEGMRYRLIDSTLEVVGHVGLEHLTIRKVSEHAGVSVGLVHHHFENKSNLVYRTFEYLIRRVREQLTAGRRGIVDPVERMKFTADMCFSAEVVSSGAANVWPHMWSSS